MLRFIAWIFVLLIPFSSAVTQDKPNTTISHSNQQGVQAQAPLNSDVLSIGGVILRLGMSRDAALPELRKYFLLQGVPYSTEEDALWMIRDKSHPEESLGEVHFVSGKLTWASKDLTHQNKQYSGADIAEIIYKVFSEFEAKGTTTCAAKNLASQQSPGPGHMEFRETQLTCGPRQVEIILNWQSGPANVQVNEIISR